MKVGLITSWNIKCGIAEYSKNFMNSLRKQGVEVEIYPINEIRDVETFSDFEHCDVLSFQYEHGLFRQSDLYDWVMRFRGLIKHPKLFITVHQVLKGDIWGSLYDMLDGVIVHSKHFGAVLKDKTYVIPHGCPVYNAMSIEEARRKLGWKNNRFLLATFGFMFPHKGWEHIIGAMPSVQKRHYKCTLLMVCSHFRDKNKTKPVAKAMKKYAKKIHANVKFFHDRWDIDDFMPLIQASNIFITSQETVDKMIISGSAMMGISARRPTITNDCSIYTQIQPYSCIVPKGSPDKLAEAILSLLSDPKLYDEYQNKAIEAYQQFNWDAVARQHMSLYMKGD